MTTKVKETTVEKTVAETPTEQTVVSTTAPAGANVPAVRESFIDPTDKSGTEDIGLRDIRLPRLRIAQGLSSQIIPGDSTYIKGLELFQMFNDLTSEIYGNGPLRFLPLLREVHIIEFDPDNRGVPLAVNLSPLDKRCEWTKDPETGKGIPPKATTYVDFVVALIKPDGAEPEPLVLSIKCTNKWQTKAAERLSTFVKLQKGPIYSGYKSLKSVSEKNDEGTFGVFLVDNDGRLDKPGQTDEQWAASMQLFAWAKKFYDDIKGKTLVVERDGVDSTDFPMDEDPNKGIPKM